MSRMFEDSVTVELPPMVWAEVCGALKDHLKTEEARNAKASWRDGLYALQEIDRVMRGAEEHAPPDDLLSLGDA